jgi:hypothetical protein
MALDVGIHNLNVTACIYLLGILNLAARQC